MKARLEKVSSLSSRFVPEEPQGLEGDRIHLVGYSTLVQTHEPACPLQRTSVGHILHDFQVAESVASSQQREWASVCESPCLILLVKLLLPSFCVDIPAPHTYARLQESAAHCLDMKSRAKHDNPWFLLLLQSAHELNEH